MNQPYVKKYNQSGELMNPITKEKPYLNFYQSQRGKSKTIRKGNNRKQYSDRDVISRLIFTQRVMRFVSEKKKQFTNLVLFHRK